MRHGILRSAKDVILPLIRRGRAVAWAPPWMRFGNQMGLSMWAYEGRLKDERRWVLRQPQALDLIGCFPTLARSYMLTPAETRFTDQRLQPWREDYVSGPDWGLLDGFVRDVVLPGSALAARDEVAGDAIVVNVRRGDYYSVPEHRQEFGINIEAYVQTALERAVDDDGMPGSLLVVSDDVGWCRAHLEPLLDAFAPIQYRPPGDAAGDLAALMHARRLIIPNSTFSKWGGYIGDVLRPGRPVYTLPVFMRSRDNGRNAENSPRWTVIEDIPGGWDTISE